MLCAGFFACSDDSLTEEMYNDHYSHKIQGCTPDYETPINCTEFVSFLENNKADILLGGGDIVFRVSYTVKGDKITLHKGNELSENMYFYIVNDDTLKRKGTDELWVKNSD